jgi:prepilin-type N-terminal cleavage/methylation domain-containing protein
MASLGYRTRRAFSLLELVIVVVILGILAAIAVPRMSRSATAAADNAVSANLAILRNAVDLFSTEHGGTYPSLANLPNALTQYSDVVGTAFAAAPNSGSGIIYGPYVREIPALPVGANKGKNTFTATLGGSFGWVYEASTGKIFPNCPDAEVDGRGVKYNTY